MANLPDVFRSNRSLFSDFFRDLDELFKMGNRSFPDIGDVGSEMIQPTVDLQEAGENYMLTFDIPGVKKEDLKIDLTDNVITVSGERRQEWNEGQTSRGRRYGKFQQSFSLPQGVDSEQVKAHYDNGVLEVLIPKPTGSQRRSIDIQAGRAKQDAIGADSEKAMPGQPEMRAEKKGDKKSEEKRSTH